MAKFMVLYNSETTASETMANTSDIQVGESMKQWINWRDNAANLAKVDFGLPLQPISKVSSSGVGVSSSKVSGYSIIEIESKEKLLELLKSHPHIAEPTSTIEVFEMLPLPSIEA